MTDAAAKPQPGMGPYYAPGEYAGFFRRLVVLLIDLFLLAISYIVAVALRELTGSWVFVLGWLVGAYLYLTLVEATIGTLGYLAAGVKIVTVAGDRPSLLRMTYRLGLWILGPIHSLIDFWWMTGDEFRQTLRDKCAGTLVIRKAASPAGTAEITLKRYTVLTYCFVFYEVRLPG